MSLTLILVIMTAIISYQAFNNPAMRQKLIFNPAVVRERGEWYRFLTHGFIHANWMHLIVNMYVLWIFGEVIERFFVSAVFGRGLGYIMYLLLYLSAIVVAAIPAYIRHAGNFHYNALGASGATSALVFAYILLDPWQWFLFPPLPALLVGILYLWYSSYMDKRGGDNIAHDAHFWGAVYGLAFTVASAIIFRPELLQYFVDALMQGPSAPQF